MSILVVGASHRTAPVELLERLAFDPDGAAKFRTGLLGSEHVSEAIVLSTCNRVEVYAEVDRFHGSVEDLSELLAEHAHTAVEEIVPSLYVHYDDAAVAHLFEVATGLDSMVVGEAQILGQVRDALRDGQAEQSVGPALNTLFQQGLRVGKRAHAETTIDEAGQSLVSVALDQVVSSVGPLADADVVIIGSGSVAALAAASVRRLGVGEIAVVSRTPAHAARLAHKVGGRPATMAELGAELAGARLLISCTASPGIVVPAELVTGAVASRGPLAVVDLALPHDVDPRVASIPGVFLVALRDFAESVNAGTAAADVAAVRAIVADEVAAFTAARAAASIAPTVVALRTMATGVVGSELARLWGRAGELTPAQRDEIGQTVRRVADKLLHEPTVRVKALAGRSPESTYADALAELFALDPAAVEAVTRPGDTA